MTSTKAHRVFVIEWLSHKAVIEATGAEEAEAKARELWANNAEHEIFKFEDSGIRGVTVEEVLCGCGAISAGTVREAAKTWPGNTQPLKIILDDRSEHEIADVLCRVVEYFRKDHFPK
jgi:hypothetical protein